MNQLEQNIINSFRLAKSDIIRLKSEIIKLSQTQEKLVESIEEMKAYELKLYHKIREFEIKLASKPVLKTQTITQTVVKRANKDYVAPKGGKKFHVTSCPFAQNIKPKNKVSFKSKTKALNEGYKPCKCVK